MSALENSPDLENIAETDRDSVWHHLVQHKSFEQTGPMIVVEGKGMRIRDINGREFLDAVSGGLWTVNVGYGRESIADAVREQLVKMCFFANSAGSIPGAQFAAALLEKMPGLSRVYFSNSGSEANEKAYKIVRQIAHKKYDGKKYKIIYRERDYHGTTITTLSSGGQNERRAQYGPYTPGFVEMPHCCEYRSQYGEIDNYGERAARELERVVLEEGADTVGAIVLEPITAGGGAITPPEGYWETIQEICQKYDILIHIDEVVCGMGRTGKWFGYEHYGVKPDIVTLAKGVASGYAAISCTVTTEDIFELFKSDESDPLDYFRDVSTFGGCAAGAAAALENMRIIEDENLVENAAVVGDYMMGRLLELKEKHNCVGDVRGKGLFAGIELVKDRASKEPIDESVAAKVVADCGAQGVLVGKTNRSIAGYNNTIALSPALIAAESDIDEIIAALDIALGRIQVCSIAART
jgi:taurine-pyruvate aminotransferase